MRLFRFLMIALVSLIALTPSVTRAQSCPPAPDPNYWTGYCDAGYCVKCRAHSSTIVVLFDPSTPRRIFGPAPNSCEDWPEGWNTGCYDLDVRGNYRLTFTIQYTCTWMGAQFEVIFDGRTLGTTTVESGGWGFPCHSGQYEQNVGSFTVDVCPGMHHADVRELTMGNYPYNVAGPAGMLGIPFAMTLDAAPLSAAPQGPIRSAEALAPITATTYPNPSSGVQVIAFRAPTGSEAPSSVEIFNVRGTRIRTLTAPGSGSERSVEWNGRDTRGLLVPNGVYFYKVGQGATGYTGRIVRSTGPSGAAASRITALSTTPPAPQPIAADPKSPGRTPPGLRPEGLYDEDGGGGGGGYGTPGHRLVMQIIEAATPFVTTDSQGNSTFNSQAAQSAGGLTPEEADLVQKMIDQAHPADMKDFEDYCLLINTFRAASVLLRAGPRDQCFDFDVPPPIPAYVCSGLHFDTEEDVRRYLTDPQRGYHQTDPEGFVEDLSPVPAWDDFTKPVTAGGCPTPNAYRYHAQIIGCGCYWTYYSAGPEPNPEYSTYTHPWWYRAAMFWYHYCHKGFQPAAACCN